MKTDFKRLVETFIGEKNVKYGLSENNQRGHKFRVEMTDLRVNGGRSLLKAECDVSEHDLEHPEYKSYDTVLLVFKSERDAEQYVRRFCDFKSFAMWTYWDDDEAFAEMMVDYGVMPYETAARLYRKRAWNKITDVMIERAGAEHFLSLDIPPYKHDGYVIYTAAFEEDWDYGYLKKTPRTDE